MSDCTANSTESQMLETIQAVNDLLKTATEASSRMGANAVLEILQFSGICPKISKTQQASSKQIAKTLEQQKRAIILAQVKNAGIDVTAGLRSLIENSNSKNVQNALANYVRAYTNRKVYNSAGLFYTILINENQADAEAA